MTDWISVDSGEWPDVGDYFECYTTRGVIVFAFMDRTYGTLFWDYAMEGDEEVTHWRIPAPPEGL